MSLENSNLIPFDERTEEEQRQIAQMGGIASGKARREKKMLRDALEILLEESHTVNGKEMSGAEMLAAKAFKEALKGNPKWWELVRDTAGQKPVEKVVVSEVDQAIMDEVESMMNDDD